MDDIKAKERVKEEFEDFAKKVARLESLKHELETMDTEGFESDAALIRAQMGNVENVSKVSRAIDALKNKIKIRKEALSQSGIISMSMHREQEKIESKIHELEGTLAKKRKIRENRQLSGREIEYVKDIPDVENELTSLREKLSEERMGHVADVKKMEGELEGIKKQLLNYMSTSAIEEKINHLEAEIAKRVNVRNRKQISKEDSESLQEVPKLQLELSSLKLQLFREKEGHAKDVQKMENEIDILKEKLAKNDGDDTERTVQIEREIEQLRAKVEDYHRHTDIKEKIRKLEEAGGKIAVAKKSQRQEIKKVRNEQEKSLKKLAGKQTEKFEKLKGELSYLKSNLQGDKNITAKAIKNFEKEIVSLKEDVLFSPVHAELQEKIKKIEELLKKKKQVRQKKQLSDKEVEYVKDIPDLEASLRFEREQIREIGQATQRVVSRDIGAYKETLQKLEDELNYLGKHLSEKVNLAGREIHALEQEVGDLKKNRIREFDIFDLNSKLRDIEERMKKQASTSQKMQKSMEERKKIFENEYKNLAKEIHESYSENVKREFDEGMKGILREELEGRLRTERERLLHEFFSGMAASRKKMIDELHDRDVSRNKLAQQLEALKRNMHSEISEEVRRLLKGKEREIRAKIEKRYKVKMEAEMKARKADLEKKKAELEGHVVTHLQKLFK